MSWLLALAPSMRSENTAWLRLLCSLSAVQPTLRRSIARASSDDTASGESTSTRVRSLTVVWPDASCATLCALVAAPSFFLDKRSLYSSL